MRLGRGLTIVAVVVVEGSPAEARGAAAEVQVQHLVRALQHRADRPDWRVLVAGGIGAVFAHHWERGRQMGDEDRWPARWPGA